MNIKEIETKTGLERATIRYYEAEGLLQPQRRENGYRDYSAEDLATLQRIRFLRQLGLTLEEIGKRIGVSKERTRQIKQQAMDRMMKYGTNMGLEAFLDG